MDYAIDPYTGDYKLSADGQLTLTEEIDNAVYLCIAVEQGSFFANPKLGSRLHLLTREKRVEHVRTLAQSYALEALRPLIDAGMATDVSAASTWRGRSTAWIVLLIEVTTADKQPRRYEFFVKVR